MSKTRTPLEYYYERSPRGRRVSFTYEGEWYAVAFRTLTDLTEQLHFGGFDGRTVYKLHKQMQAHIAEDALADAAFSELAQGVDALQDAAPAHAIGLPDACGQGHLSKPAWLVDRLFGALCVAVVVLACVGAWELLR